MFEQGEYIVYGSTGVCKVEKVTTMDMDGVPGDKLYYILKDGNPGIRHQGVCGISEHIFSAFSRGPCH